MAAIFVRGYTFGATETVTNTKLHSLVDSATVSNIGASELASGAVTGPKIAMGSDAQGDVLYHDGTSYARLGAGTKGQALTTGGASANPSWTGMTTQGDLEYHNGTTRTRLAAGTNGMALTTGGASANPAWAGMTTRGDLEYMGASTRTRLAVGSANTVLKSDGTDPAWSTITALLDSLFSSSRGAILYRGSSAWAALAPGTSGYFLKTNGAGADPAWAAVSSGQTINAWGTYDGVANTIRASLNLTSVTDNGTGDFTFNWSITFSDAYYCALGSASQACGLAVVQGGTYTTTTLEVITRTLNAGISTDCTYTNVIAVR